jgi:hypothetical protein
MTENTTLPSNVMEHVASTACSWWCISSVGGDRVNQRFKKKKKKGCVVAAADTPTLQGGILSRMCLPPGIDQKYNRETPGLRSAGKSLQMVVDL